ncbi:MAG: glycoside hydrolase family 2 protein, partial [Kiritimatiellia bacterium]
WGLRSLSSVSGDRSFTKSIPAQVPGDVLSDLLAAKLIADPFYRENEDEVQWVGEADWQYRRDFQVPKDLLLASCVMLQCDGLDTLATILINGKKVAGTDNMHRRYEWDVKPLLKSGRNTIQVTFSSVNAYTRERFPENPIRLRVDQGTPNAYPGWVRKEACNFGWDWGPILVTAGIWRSIRLVGYSVGRIDDVEIRQQHANGSVTLATRCTLGVLGEANLRTKLIVSLHGIIVAQSEASARGGKTRHKVDIAKPQLWWPNGMGAQPLYEVRVMLLAEDGEVLDTNVKRVGLRTLRLDRHADEWGESFQFVVNGVPFFAKGANWIPADALPGHRPDAVYRRLLEDSVAVNMNMIRVWGGGVYENDVFYDICDELGLCVWQDFMFACMGYPAWDKAFLASVEAEARDNVRRLRHHACIALWCGNNELEQQGVGENPKIHMQWKDYKRLFDVLLPRVVKQLAADMDYWPCSPHSPHGDRADYNNPSCGDAHLWDVWHGKKPFEWYRTCGHRFNSEFGFQSFPEPKTVYGYTEKGDRNVTTPVMEHHQRSGIGNTTIMQYMLDWFRLPTSFEMTLWASQILQGMA